MEKQNQGLATSRFIWEIAIETMCMYV